jgi:hypothetical protein
MKALAVYETAFGARRQRSTTRSTEPPIHVAAGRRSTEPPLDSVIASIGIASFGVAVAVADASVAQPSVEPASDSSDGRMPRSAGLLLIDGRERHKVGE